MKREEAVLFYVHGLLDEMRRCKFLEAPMHFTELGLEMYRGLREDNFTVSEAEIDNTVKLLVSIGKLPSEQAGMLASTLKAFDKDPRREERIKRVEQGLSPFFEEPNK